LVECQEAVREVHAEAWAEWEVWEACLSFSAKVEVAWVVWMTSLEAEAALLSADSQASEVWEAWAEWAAWEEVLVQAAKVEAKNECITNNFDT